MKKCAVLNDLSGFGKCSLCASIPIISVMGSEVHPLVTAVLSNQTAYDSYKSHSLTDVIPEFIDEWEKLGCTFDAILTGYFSDVRQIEIAIDFIERFSDDNTVVIVDPVMADNGALYDSFTVQMCDKIKLLCSKADIITPNISELAILDGKGFCNTLDEIKASAQALIDNGIENIVVTGYRDNGHISNLIFNGNDMKISTAKETGGYFSGTGDIFTSILTGGVMRGQSLYDSVSLATRFIEKAVAATDASNHNDGIDFERFLVELI